MADLAQDLWNLVGAFGRRERRNRLANDFRRRVAVHLLGTFVPVRNHSIEVLPDDGILGRVNDERDAGLMVSQLAAFSFVEFLVRPAKFLFNPLAIADVSNSAQNDDAISARDGAERDFYGKFRPIASAAIKIQTRSHAADLRLLMKLFTVQIVPGSLPLGNQNLDLLPNQLIPGVPEQ